MIPFILLGVPALPVLLSSPVTTSVYTIATATWILLLPR